MTRTSVLALLALALLVPGHASASGTDLADAEAIYAEWLQHYADREPELAIEMTSDDFIMVNNTNAMNRDQALEFVQGVAQFILSRECTNAVVAGQPLAQKSFLLLSRVDCQFQTVLGPLEAHFLETLVIDKHGVIVYDAFSDLADSSL
jgi:hypothetical protein